MSGNRSSGIRETVERAVHASGIAIAIHRYDGPVDDERLVSAGQVAACRSVCGASGGRPLCDASRSAAARVALRQERSVPFVCHLGFSCLSVPIPNTRAEVATLGPFITGSTVEVVQTEVNSAFIKLVGGQLGDPPVALGELRSLDIDAVYALGEWLVSSLSEVARVDVGNQEAVPPSSAKAASRSDRKRDVRIRANNSAQITALVAGGDWLGLQKAVAAALNEVGDSASGMDAARARVLGLALAVLENAPESERTSDPWDRFDILYQACREANGMAELHHAIVRFFRETQPKATDGGSASRRLDEELSRAIRLRLPGRVTVGAVAGELGLTAGAVSHRLRRRFGLTFSEYVGRLRMDEAKRLLRETALSATEVGVRVGISDQSNFSKQFSKIAGCSPGAYRQQYGRKR